MIITKSEETIFTADQLNLSKIKLNEIKGAPTTELAAKLFYEILAGNGTESQKNVVCANAAFAIATVDNCSILEGFEKAKESLTSGKAMKKMNILQELSK